MPLVDLEPALLAQTCGGAPSVEGFIDCLAAQKPLPGHDPEWTDKFLAIISRCKRETGEGKW